VRPLYAVSRDFDDRSLFIFLGIARYF